MDMMRRYGYLVFFLLGLGSYFSCSTPERESHRGIYHWQTRLQLADQEIDFLEKAAISKLYVRFFDVDKEPANEPLPQATLQFSDTLPSTLEIIPTVFLTNRTFLEMTEEGVDSLAERTVRKIHRLWKHFPEHHLQELQLDCDWSGRTREAYFRFLRRVKERIAPDHTQLSVTIRLHQLKYPRQTGVPPADRGMLMFYNMGDLEDPQTLNSILDTTIAQQYMTSAASHYPLELDIVLPIFSWGVLFREGKMIKLINNLLGSRLEEDNRFDKIEKNQFRLRQSTYLDGYYLYKGDEIRCEKVSYPELMKSAAMLRPLTRHHSSTTAYYHLDTATLKNYTHEELETLYQYFEHPN